MNQFSNDTKYLIINIKLYYTVKYIYIFDELFYWIIKPAFARKQASASLKTICMHKNIKLLFRSLREKTHWIII